MADWLAARVRASPDATALTGRRSGERLSYTELDAQATRRAQALRSFGIGAGDHVGVALGVGVASVALVHAVSRLGAVLVPLSPRLTGSELETRVQHADCDLLVRDETGRAAASAVDSVRVVSIDEFDWVERKSVRQVGGEGSEASSETGASEARRNEVIEPGERHGSGGAGTRPSVRTGVKWKGSLDYPFVILFTSGTTGRPKGVVLTAGNVLASAGASAARLGVLPGDRWLLALSLGGMGGLAPIYRSVLYGTALVLQGTFEPREVLQTLSEAECTGVSLVPTMLDRMLDTLEASGEKRSEEGGRNDEGSDRGGQKEGSEGNGRFPAGVRCVLLGGAPASAELIERCREHGVPVYPTYGMTETASQVATARPAEAFSYPGTVGRPLMGVDVAAVEDGRVLEASERGELVVRGPIVTPGYYGNAEGSEEDFSERGFHTGDLGYVDSEGRVFVTGRLDDRIVTGGQTVDPEEVRTTLRAHPAVRDAAVVGLDSDEWGERVGALVVPETNDIGETDGADEGNEEGAVVSEAALDTHCRASLAGYKLPRVLAFADALPRTESGTIDRIAVATELRDLAETEREDDEGQI